MKYLVSFFAAAVVQYVFMLKHPLQQDALPFWLELGVSVLLLTLLPFLICRFLSNKIRNIIIARLTDLGILLLGCLLYWKVGLRLDSQITVELNSLGFWLQISFSSWATLFLPFGVTIAVFDLIEQKQKSRPNKPADTTPVSASR